MGTLNLSCVSNIPISPKLSNRTEEIKSRATSACPASVNPSMHVFELNENVVAPNVSDITSVL